MSEDSHRFKVGDDVLIRARIVDIDPKRFVTVDLGDTYRLRGFCLASDIVGVVPVRLEPMKVGDRVAYRFRQNEPMFIRAIVDGWAVLKPCGPAYARSPFFVPTDDLVRA